MRPYPPTCDPLTHLPPTHALALPPQLFSPADVALRLRGRELVAPDEAWAHFYPEPLAEPREDALTGVPMMGVPSVDEFARTRGWLHQKVLGIRGDCTYLLHCTTTVLREDFVGLTFLLTKYLPRCSAPISSGCASYCATVRDAPRCAPMIHPPTSSRTIRTASR